MYKVGACMVGRYKASEDTLETPGGSYSNLFLGMRLSLTLKITVKRQGFQRDGIVHLKNVGVEKG